MPPVLRRRVLEIYREADREVAAAGPVCVASGRCCRFKEWGHVLYVSSLEADVLLSQAPPYEAPVSAEFCPFQKESLCTAREPRPLACRVYYCDPNYQETGNRITEKYLTKLKELAASEGVEWRYAPLHVFLNESSNNHSARIVNEAAGREGKAPAEPVGQHRSKIGLPLQ